MKILLPFLIVVTLSLCTQSKSSQDESDETRFLIADQQDFEAYCASLEASNAGLYNQLEKAMLKDNDKVKSYYDKAMRIKKTSLELCNFIEQISSKLKGLSEGITNHTSDTLRASMLSHPDDVKVPRDYLVGDDINKPIGKAVELKSKMIAYHDQIVSMLDSIGSSGRAWSFQRLNCPDIYVYSNTNPGSMSWEKYNFYNASLVASLSRLSSMKFRIKSAERDMVTELLSKTY